MERQLRNGTAVKGTAINGTAINGTTTKELNLVSPSLLLHNIKLKYKERAILYTN